MLNRIKWTIDAWHPFWSKMNLWDFNTQVKVVYMNLFWIKLSIKFSRNCVRCSCEIHLASFSLWQKYVTFQWRFYRHQFLVVSYITEYVCVNFVWYLCKIIWKYFAYFIFRNKRINSWIIFLVHSNPNTMESISIM